MIEIDLNPRVVKFIQRLPPKHQKQIKAYLLALCEDPLPHDAKPLIGYEAYMRADCGEYRIVYRFDKKIPRVTVTLIGKRNDGDVYLKLKRL